MKNINAVANVIRTNIIEGYACYLHNNFPLESITRAIHEGACLLEDTVVAPTAVVAPNRIESRDGKMRAMVSAIYNADSISLDIQFWWTSAALMNKVTLCSVINALPVKAEETTRERLDAALEYYIENRYDHIVRNMAEQMIDRNFDAIRDAITMSKEEMNACCAAKN